MHRMGRGVRQEWGGGVEVVRTLVCEKSRGAMTLNPGTWSPRYIAIHLGSSIFFVRQQLLLALFIIASIISNIVVWVNGLVTAIKPPALFTRQKLLFFYDLSHAMLCVIMVF